MHQDMLVRVVMCRRSSSSAKTHSAALGSGMHEIARCNAWRFLLTRRPVPRASGKYRYRVRTGHLATSITRGGVVGSCGLVVVQVIEEHGIGIGIGVWEGHPRMKTAEMFLSINPLANIGCLLDSQPMDWIYLGRPRPDCRTSNAHRLICIQRRPWFGYSDRHEISHGARASHARMMKRVTVTTHTFIPLRRNTRYLNIIFVHFGLR